MPRLLFVLALLSATAAFAAPPYASSVVGTEIDFIRSDDPAPRFCINPLGPDRAEMPDKRNDVLFADGVLVFEAVFADATQVNLFAHPDLGEREARLLVEAVVPRLAKLPTFMRRTLSHVVLHSGDETAFAESDGGFFVLYSGNVAKRIATNDLEETVFHEAVHATLDRAVLGSRGWRAAQRSDGAFLTRYAAANPDKEDLAETALFAFALRTPGRLDASVERTVRTLVPARLAYLADLFERNEPLQRGLDVPMGCP